MARKTIKDIARESGYSTGTVSRVLNDSGPVSEAARNKIMEIVDKYGFQLNTNAKFLKQRMPDGIAVIIRGTHNLLFASLVELIQQRIERAGYSASMFYLEEEGDEVQEAIEICQKYLPEGLLFLGSSRQHFMQNFSKIPVPAVMVTNSADGFGFRNLGSVTTNDSVAAQVVVDTLLRLGHKKIGVLGGDVGISQAALARYQGVQYTLYDHDLNFDVKSQYFEGDFSIEAGYEGMDYLLDHNPDMTAVFAMADVMAMGAIRAAYDRGLRVPEDISVVGYDGIAQAAYTVPRLATIVQNQDDMAEKSVAMLLSMIEQGASPEYLESPFQFVEGESLRACTGNEV